MTDTLPLKERLQGDMKTAMREKDKDRLGAIRLILAAIKQKEVDERVTVDDQQVFTVLDKMTKQRRDSIQQYEAANRQDLAQKEKYELEIIQSYLPAQLTRDELEALVEKAVAETGATSPKDMGKVMAALKPKIQGRADMGQTSNLVKNRLDHS